MVDAAYPFDVAATLRLAHAESGRFDVLGDDQLVRCEPGARVFDVVLRRRR